MPEHPALSSTAPVLELGWTGEEQRGQGVSEPPSPPAPHKLRPGPGELWQPSCSGVPAVRPLGQAGILVTLCTSRQGSPCGVGRGDQVWPRLSGRQRQQASRVIQNLNEVAANYRLRGGDLGAAEWLDVLCVKISLNPSYLRGILYNAKLQKANTLIGD